MCIRDRASSSYSGAGAGIGGAGRFGGGGRRAAFCRGSWQTSQLAYVASFRKVQAGQGHFSAIITAPTAQPAARGYLYCSELTAARG